MARDVSSYNLYHEFMSQIAERSGHPKLIAVTGGTSGIGLATAKKLLSDRCSVVIGGRRALGISELGPQYAEFLERGLLRVMALDVTNSQSVEEFFDYIASCSHPLDTLINCAGVMKLAPIEDLKIDEWEEMININVMGLLRCTAKCIPIFRKNGMGKVINIGSIAGHKVATPDGTVYSATKFAVSALSEGMRQELAEMNISVTLVSCGATKTELGQNSSNQYSKQRISDYYAIYGMEVEDVAKQIAEIAVSNNSAQVSEIVLRSLHHRF